MFKKGDVVKVVAIVPQGPIQAMRMDEEGNVYCMLEWADESGVMQQRWFKAEELAAV